MARTATWERIGTDVRGSISVKEALQTSGLDFEVIKTPIYLSDGTEIGGKVATVDEKSGKVFGVVSSNYGIVQNQDAFDFVDSLVGEGLEFVKAGTAWNDNIIYLICKLSEYNILRDQIAPYIILQNSFSGFTPLKVAVTDLRIICQNQFNFAFSKANNVLNLKHTNSINGKLNQAYHVVKLAEQHMKENVAVAENLANTKLSQNQITNVIKNIFDYDPTSSSQKLINNMVDKQNTLRNIYENTPDLANYKGTAYGIVQAYSDMITHEQTRKADDRQFIAVTLTPNFMQQIIEITKSV